MQAWQRGGSNRPPPADKRAVSAMTTNVAFVLLVRLTFGLLICAHRRIGR
jgi:hypothetical protein